MCQGHHQVSYVCIQCEKPATVFKVDKGPYHISQLWKTCKNLSVQKEMDFNCLQFSSPLLFNM